MLYIIALIGAIKVVVGTITSSFSRIFNTFKEICNADVPFIQGIAYFAFINFLTIFVNLSLYLYNPPQLCQS